MRNLCINCVAILLLFYLGVQLCTSSHRNRKCCIGHTLSFSLARARFLNYLHQCENVHVCISVCVFVYVYLHDSSLTVTASSCGTHLLQIWRRLAAVSADTSNSIAELDRFSPFALCSFFMMCFTFLMHFKLRFVVVGKRIRCCEMCDIYCSFFGIE